MLLLVAQSNEKKSPLEKKHEKKKKILPGAPWRLGGSA
jgi:hypothetical protein